MPKILAVPGAYPTIADALEVAPDGAVISLAPGTYRERMRLTGRRLTVQASGEAGSAIVDATGLDGPALAVTSGEVTVEGVVLTGGDYPAVTAAGGRLQLRKCELSAGYGAGLQATDGTAVDATEVRVVRGQHGFVFSDAGGTVESCEIRDVTGDGIIVRLGADPIIRGTTVADCGYRGVYVYQSGRPTIERCDISGTGDAGILVAQHSSPKIVQTWVHDTRADAPRDCSAPEGRSSSQVKPGLGVLPGDHAKLAFQLRALLRGWGRRRRPATRPPPTPDW